MPKKSKTEEIKPAELSKEEIHKGIIKIERRLKELNEFDIQTIEKRWDSKISAMEEKINNTLAEIFGHNTVEYRNFHISTIDTLPLWMGQGDYPLNNVREGYKEGIKDAVIKLTSLKEILQEKCEDLEPSVVKSITALDFWNDIHPKIAVVSKSRYEAQHYADSVESALKEVNNCVKNIYKRKTGKELDGADLMHTAFSPNNPTIVLSDLSTDSGKSMQQGYMEVFAGAMTGIRNPKAHENLDITENRARHFIYLASLLMQKIDEKV
jgi:uncharacterized protein (TIGR02391 family)